MKTCSIEIVTFTRGERLHTVTNGTLEEHPQGFTLFYTQESEPVCLCCRGQTVFMERQGESQLSAFFSTNDEGVFSFGLGQNAGTVPLQTEICSVRALRDGWRITLKYRLMFNNQPEIFRLKIAVNIISEEQ